MIYFIRAKHSGRIKIGKANNPASRFQSFKTASPEPLELLGAIPGGYEKEAELHKLYAAFRMHGEWFRGEPALLDDIEWMLIDDRAERHQWELDALECEPSIMLGAEIEDFYGGF